MISNFHVARPAGRRRTPLSLIAALLPAAALLLLAVPAFAAASAPPAPDAVSAASKPYVISAYDQLDISVAGHDELKSSVMVLPDGTFSLPDAGTIHAGGMTVAALSTLLTKKYSVTINQPDVTITVRVATPQSISVLGAVKAPGRYDLKDGARILDALAAAGGLSEDVDWTQVTLVTDHGAKSVACNIQTLMNNADPDQNVLVSRGDVLLVQAHDAAEVQVAGEVTKPGAFPAPAAGVSLITMLTQAGGALPDADMSRAQILHAGKARTLNLMPLNQDIGSDVGSTVLLPGDVLQIPASTSKIAVLGQVVKPGAYDVPAGTTLTITAALVLSGGPNYDADSKHCSFLRLDSNGKAVVTPVNLSDVLSGKSQNVALQSGDILYIASKGDKQAFNPWQLLSLVPVIGLLR